MLFNLTKYINKIQQNFYDLSRDLSHGSFHDLSVVKFYFSNLQDLPKPREEKYILLIDYKIPERNIELIFFWLFYLIQIISPRSKKYRQYIQNGGIANTKYQYFSDYELIAEQSFYFGLVQSYLLKKSII